MDLRIREERERRGLTLQQVAEKIGTTKGFLSELERGKRRMNSTWLEKISRALGCAPYELLDDGSVPADVFEHVRTLLDLSDGDRAAVIRHAESLEKRNSESAD